MNNSEVLANAFIKMLGKKSDNFFVLGEFLLEIRELISEEASKVIVDAFDKAVGGSGAEQTLLSVIKRLVKGKNLSDNEFCDVIVQMLYDDPEVHALTLACLCQENLPFSSIGKATLVDAFCDIVDIFPKGSPAKSAVVRAVDHLCKNME